MFHCLAGILVGMGMVVMATEATYQQGPNPEVLHLIFANDNDAPSRVYFNDGLGTFALEQDLGIDRYFSVALGDLNGDGAADLFLAACCGFPARVWFNDGAGQFSDSGQVIGAAMGDTYDVALGDVDGDGDLDAFLAENFNLFTGNGFANHVWLNDGHGFFSDSGQSLGASFSHGVALGDLDGDMDLDAFVANINCDSARIWLNDGNGVFTDSGQTFGNEGSESVALGDLDGDGDLDAALANGFCAANNNLGTRILLNDGGGNFTDSGQRLGNLDSKDIALGDIDNDDDLDLVVGNDGGGSPNEVWLNDGLGQFSDSGAALGLARTAAVALGDVDGDDDLDLVSANLGEANRIWFNNAGLFTDSGQTFGNHFTWDVALASLVPSCTPEDADAGPDQWVCGNVTFLDAAPPANGPGMWSIVSGTGGTLTDSGNPATAFQGSTGVTYTLRWTVGAGECASIDDVRITFTDELAPLLPAWPAALTVLEMANLVSSGCSETNQPN